MMILDSKGGGTRLTTPSQKVVAVLLLLAFAVGVFYIAEIISLIVNIWIAIALGVPLVCVVLYCIFNPLVIWSIFNNLSAKATNWIISQDKIGMLEMSHKYLIEKYGRLETTVIKISGAKKTLARQISEYETKMSENYKKYTYLEKEHPNPDKKIENDLNYISSMIATDKGVIDNLKPKLEIINSNEQYLLELMTFWGNDIRTIGYLINAKKEEYQIYKSTAEALGEAEEFINGNTEQSRIYNESLRQLEEEVTTFMARIENFEKKASPLISNGRIEEAMKVANGKQLLEEYKALSISKT